MTDIDKLAAKAHWSVEATSYRFPPRHNIGNAIIYDPTPGGKKNADGSTSFQLRFPAIVLTELVDDQDTALADIANALNQYDTIKADRDRLTARVAELEAAMEPFAKHIDEMKFDLDNHGDELPDDQSVGWVYVTNGDFRAARRALACHLPNGKSPATEPWSGISGAAKASASG
ncbi:MAG: hypothetical protein IT552_12340 [Sphingomonadaceae bacterium]|nr:hypothetical protein [Sphingomonadaceae bacterium]